MNNSFYTALILLTSIISCAIAIFVVPSILDAPRAERRICFSRAIENSMTGPDQIAYLECVNDAVIKIESATLVLSSPDSCPLQYTNLANQAPPTCNSRNYANSNITTVINTLCNARQECFFTFSDFAPLICIENAPATMTNIPSRFQQINVNYRCNLPRRRFRPFSNKRYNMKFSRTINHPVRKMSYNRLMSL